MLGRRGRPQLYSDPVILMVLSIKNFFKLPLRATQGFLESVLKIPLSVPNYTLLSKRAKTLGIPLLRLSKGENIDVVIDSTGLKVYGEEEWKVRTHGVSKRLTWRKIHLGIDPKSKEILASVITTNDTIFGSILSSRSFETQSMEAFVRVLCLNLITSLGMPDSYPLSA